MSLKYFEKTIFPIMKYFFAKLCKYHSPTLHIFGFVSYFCATLKKNTPLKEFRHAVLFLMLVSCFSRQDWIFFTLSTSFLWRVLERLLNLITAVGVHAWHLLSFFLFKHVQAAPPLSPTDIKNPTALKKKALKCKPIIFKTCVRKKTTCVLP